MLVAAHVSEAAATTVYGLTLRRLWATSVVVLALVGVVTGAVAVARPASRFGAASGPRRAVVALAAGVIAGVNGGLNLAVATGGPGKGGDARSSERWTITQPFTGSQRPAGCIPSSTDGRIVSEILSALNGGGGPPSRAVRAYVAEGKACTQRWPASPAIEFSEAALRSA